MPLLLRFNHIIHTAHSITVYEFVLLATNFLNHVCILETFSY